MEQSHQQQTVIAASFVRKVITFDNNDSKRSVLPFFADGFPGLMWYKTTGSLTIHPHGKTTSPIFVYGQTITPVEIEVNGKYQIVIFQLFPFAVKGLFGIDPKSINDGCYDLTTADHLMVNETLTMLSSGMDISSNVRVLGDFINGVAQSNGLKFDSGISRAVEIILKTNGQLRLRQIAEELCLTKRTLERRFLKETGLLPKQFAKIVQFQSSLTQLEARAYDVLSDVVYQNGYADHSHFTRVFKKFTSMTPRRFNKASLKS